MKYAEVEWVTPDWLFTVYRQRVGILRVWDEDQVPEMANKNPYSWVCTVVHRSDDEIEFKGVMFAPTIIQYRNIVDELTRLGYKRGFWYRYDPETKKERRISFSPKHK